ncbi:MAG: 50S ribosomal protein L2 [Omnitrophica bacterium RIFCSPLOWO2_01_FULL_45_10]|nr:MAG: 50S ribosomal protein L2 [Omnitrophica bacterium RIFCSPLOWO2_01_FULL_45_10]
MGIKKFKPTTDALRWAAIADFEELTKSKPEKRLLVPLRKSGGRNVYGRITSRHRGGGHKRQIRLIDFKRDKLGVPAKVIGIEYDPNRSARLALVEYQDKERRYIIAPAGLNVNDEVMAGKSCEIKTGNALPLENIPVGIPIHNVELRRGSGAAVARSAGNSCVIMAKEAGYAQVKLPSGEIRMVGLDAFATIGQVGNIEHGTISLGKAGRSRWLGRRPYSRGVAKNPHDHPMGGGEGKASGGQPRSPWGQYAKGLKTRKKKKHSDKYIIKRRK